MSGHVDKQFCDEEPTDDAKHSGRQSLSQQHVRQPLPPGGLRGVGEQEYREKHKQVREAVIEAAFRGDVVSHPWWNLRFGDRTGHDRRGHHRVRRRHDGPDQQGDGERYAEESPDDPGGHHPHTHHAEGDDGDGPAQVV